MDIEALRTYCLAQKGTTEELPFGPDTLVFKVGGKIFLLVGLDQIGSLSFNVKCDPEQAITLRNDFPDTVVPGYHMNKKHWNTVYANRQLDDAELQGLIDASYQLVWSALPVRSRKAIEEEADSL